jgi:acyl carrier protein
MEKKQIEGIIRELIGKRLTEVKPDTICIDTELDSLGLDSVTASWILADMEEAFGFDMPGTENCILKTLGTAVDYVKQHAAR